jgi:hypothetical protein
MVDSQGYGMNFTSENLYPLLREIIDGRPARDALNQYAEQLDTMFELFRNDAKAYGECVRNSKPGCVF